MSAYRTTTRGDQIEVALVRSFLDQALAHDAISGEVHELLFEHVAEDRLHPTVVAASLKSLIQEVIDAATSDDWHAISGTLIAEAHAALTEP